MQQNKCFACENPVQEDVYFKNRWICVNQRCIRFGLLSVIFLSPPPPEPAKKEEPVKQDKKKDAKV